MLDNDWILLTACEKDFSIVLILKRRTNTQKASQRNVLLNMLWMDQKQDDLSLGGAESKPTM